MKLRSLVGNQVEIVGPEASIADVAALMLERDVAAVAVVDRTGLVGICTDRDLSRGLAGGCDGSELVSRLMTENPDVIDPDVDVVDAARWMVETGYRHLPVVEEGALLGIVDIRNILWAVVSND